MDPPDLYPVPGWLENGSSIGLALFIFAVFSLNGHRVIEEPGLVLKILGPVSMFLVFLIVISILAGKMSGMTREDAVALTISTTPKNNAIAMALAYTAFGGDVALINTIAGPLVQLPVMLLYIGLYNKFTFPQT